MPDEYISRAEALEITTRTCGDYAAAFAEIRKLPAVDVAPVVHGEWIGNKGGFWEMATCSMCDERYPCVGMAPNFCPNCGARMDGAAE